MVLKDDLFGMIMRGIVTLVDDGKKCQALQLEVLDEDDVVEDVENFQPFGVSFRAPVGSEAIVCAVTGDQNHLVVLGIQNRSKRPKNVKENEGGLYVNGVYRVFLDENGVVYLGGPDASEPAVLGQSLKTWLDAHVHPTPFGPTGGPVTPLPTSALSTVVKVK